MLVEVGAGVGDTVAVEVGVGVADEVGRGEDVGDVVGDGVGERVEVDVGVGLAVGLVFGRGEEVGETVGDDVGVGDGVTLLNPGPGDSDGRGVDLVNASAAHNLQGSFTLEADGVGVGFAVGVGVGVGVGVATGVTDLAPGQVCESLIPELVVFVAAKVPD